MTGDPVRRSGGRAGQPAETRTGTRVRCPPRPAGDYLGRGCGVVVVDVVTTRRADLQADLLAMLGADTAVEALGGIVRRVLSTSPPG